MISDNPNSPASGRRPFGDVSGAVVRSEPYSVAIAASSDPKRLDPWGGNNTGGRRAVLLGLYEPLAYYTTDGGMELLLAKSVQRVGESVYEVIIHDCVFDTAGNHMTADDVVFSYGAARAGGMLKSAFASFKSIEKTGDYAVRLTFENERARALSFLLDAVVVVTEAAWRASPDAMLKTPVGTGAYRLKGYVPLSTMTLERTGVYWQTDESLISPRQRSYPQTITYHFTLDKSDGAPSLISGQVEYSHIILQSDYSRFLDAGGRAKAGYKAYSVINPQITSIVFNCGERSACHNENLRKAIACAIDCAGVALGMNGELGLPCVQFTSKAFPEYNPAYERTYNAHDGGYYYFDRDRALEYLRQSAYDGSTLTLISHDSLDRVNAAELVARYCAKIGINIRVVPCENSEYTALANTADNSRWDMCMLFTAVTVSNYNVFERMNLNFLTNGLNNAYVNDPVLQELIDAAGAVETGSTEPLYAALDYLAERLYQFALVYHSMCILTRDCITSFSVDQSNDVFPGSIMKSD